jgi:hypothetical protein
MDDALKAKLDEARERMSGRQVGINANRKHDDPAMREWARGKQRPANAERAQFRNSLTDEDRSQIEERIEQLVHNNPTLSPTNAWAKDSETEPPSVSLEVLDEYFFLRGILSDAQPTASVPAVRKQSQVTAMWQKYLGRYYAVMTMRLRNSRR